MKTERKRTITREKRAGGKIFRLKRGIRSRTALEWSSDLGDFTRFRALHKILVFCPTLASSSEASSPIIFAMPSIIKEGHVRPQLIDYLIIMKTVVFISAHLPMKKVQKPLTMLLDSNTGAGSFLLPRNLSHTTFLQRAMIECCRFGGSGFSSYQILILY